MYTNIRALSNTRQYPELGIFRNFAFVVAYFIFKVNLVFHCMLLFEHNKAVFDIYGYCSSISQKIIPVHSSLRISSFNFCET